MSVRAGIPRLGLSLALLAACRSASEGPVRRLTPLRAGAEPTLQHKKLDPLTGQPMREWNSLRSGERPGAKHGKETVYRKDGTKEWEKEWDKGKPAGVWRSWYANGQMRSECFFAGPNEERVMTFWYENGQRRLQGPALDGVRCGHWKVWYADGGMAEEGEYVGSRREGEWQAWSADGTRTFVRVYEHNVRVAEREGLVAPDAGARPQ